MKIIFLDFDGVLNSCGFLSDFADYGVAIDPTRMVLLKEIVSATGAEIVLSTSWREHWSKEPEKCDETGVTIQKIFHTYGLTILDKTPVLHTRREAEVRKWLDEHPDVTNFVVLDDRLLHAEFLNGHFVKTSGYFSGLDEKDVKDAIEILNGSII